MTATRRFTLLACLTLAAGSLTACVSGERVAFEPNMQDETVVGDYLKARFAADQQQLDVAADAYARAAEAAPQDALLLRHAFFYELAAGNVTEARAYAEQLSQPEYRLDETDENTPQAIASMRQAMAAARAQQTLSLPMLTIAADQMRDGDYRAALETLDADTDLAYAESIAHLMRAWATYETDGVDAGIAALNDTAGQSFTTFNPLHRAMMLEAANRRSEAREAYERAVEAYPAEQTRLAQAAFLERTGERDAARALYRTMVEESGVLTRSGRLGLIRTGEPLAGETREMMLEARRLRQRRFVSNGAEGAGVAFYQFAWATYRQAISEQAAAARAGFTNMQALLNTPLAFAQLSTHLNEDFDPVHYLVGGIYSNYEMYDDAARVFGKVSFHDSFYEYAVSDRAAAYVAAEEPEKAMALLEDYVARDAYAVSASLSLAGLLSDEERYAEAEDTITTAIERLEARPENERGDLWRYYFSRGILYTDLNDWQRAEADLIRAEELSDGEPYVLNFLGYSWVERGENLEVAFDMIEQALDREPNSGAITDSLGWAYYQLGQYEQAIDYLERAVELEPADAVITDHLGDAYWQVGRTNEARYEWRRALTFEPEEELRAAIEEKLATGEVITASAGLQ